MALKIGDSIPSLDGATTWLRNKSVPNDFTSRPTLVHCRNRSEVEAFPLARMVMDQHRLGNSRKIVGLFTRWKGRHCSHSKNLSRPKGTPVNAQIGNVAIQERVNVL